MKLETGLHLSYECNSLVQFVFIVLFEVLFVLLIEFFLQEKEDTIKKK